ncbi:unnamed protein product [Rotaria sp. Silwood2]
MSLLSIDKTTAYENYLSLWKTILNVTTLKEFYTNIYSIFDRQNMFVSFYDIIIDSILYIIDRLDLNIEKDKTKSNCSVSATRSDIEMMETDINDNEQVATIFVSCLQFIISLPLECIDYDFTDYVPAIQITACELLQSIMLYMIGKSANNRSNAATSYEKFYEHLFPLVQELSFDSDQGIKGILTYSKSTRL